MNLAQRFARLATDAVVRRPVLWRVFRRPMRRMFEALAPVWDTRRTPGFLDSYEAALEAVPAPPRRALDLGTGTGAGAFAIARRWPTAEVVGVDLSERMVEEARRKIPPELSGRIEFAAADAARLPFPDSSFDLVGLANMIPFWDELARVLAPGGHVVFGYSDGPDTPIFVAPERLRSELGRRGFADFAEFSPGQGTSLLARKSEAQ